MSALLFAGLLGVLFLGVAGVVLAGSIVEPKPYDPGTLDERLAVVRKTTPPRRLPTTTRSRRPADAAATLARVVESIARPFEPVVARRMRSDVATSRSVRTTSSS